MSNPRPDCDWCRGVIGGGEPVDPPLSATHIVAGVPMCLDHAVGEVTEMLTNPANYVHSWPTDPDEIEKWRDVVPFRLEVTSLAIPTRGECPRCFATLEWKELPDFLANCLGPNDDGTDCCGDPLSCSDPWLVADLVCPAGCGRFTIPEGMNDLEWVDAQ